MNSTRRSRIGSSAVVALLVSACASAGPAAPATPTLLPPAPPPVLAPASAPAPLLDDGDLASLRSAVDRSLGWFRAIRPDSAMPFGARRVTAGRMTTALTELSTYLGTSPAPAPAALSAWILERFDVLEMPGENPGRVQVTGYFEPLIKGSRTRTERAQIPVYGLPTDLLTVRLRDFREALPDESIVGRIDNGRFVPYFDRTQIQEQGAIEGRAPIIAWAENRVDLFFVEIQGSGAIQFEDGSEMRVGYAGTNGRPYRAIGRLLVVDSILPLDRVSMQSIRKYLDDNPNDVRRVLAYNPSYIFFRTIDTPPVGALGVPVTGGRSIATDLSLFPRGALAFLDTTRPTIDANGRVVPGDPLRRFVLNQDTGGAIRGGARADFFWGRGPEAAASAGIMNQEGRLRVLVPKEVP